MWLLKTKFKIVMWDVLTGDFSNNISPARILKASIDGTQSGSIIVFHDHEKAFKNLQGVLPKYLEHFRNLGFQFKSL